MQLFDLEPEFISYEPSTDGHSAHCVVETIGRCQGIRFLCPKCFRDNGGPVGTHMILCWSSTRGVPDTAVPKPGRWWIYGTGIGDVTLSAEYGISSSIHLQSDCGWHGFIANGYVFDD